MSEEATPWDVVRIYERMLVEYRCAGDDFTADIILKLLNEQRGRAAWEWSEVPSEQRMHLPAAVRALRASADEWAVQKALSSWARRWMSQHRLAMAKRVEKLQRGSTA